MKYGKLKYLWFILFSAMLLTGCNSDKPFDPQEWKRTGLDGQITDVRELMVNDLLESDTLIGLTENSLLDLLGEPIHRDSAAHCLSFLVREKYGWNIDPEYISYLKVYFNSKDMVVAAKLVK